LNALYGYFILPESLPKENRRSFSWKRANPLGSMLHFRKYEGIGGLTGAMVLIYIAGHALQSNWTFFTIEKFNWDEKLIGISLGVIGFITALVQGGLIRFINPILGDKKSIYIGLSFYTVGMLLFAFSTKSWMLFAFMIPYCMGGIAGPALQAVISSQVPINEQGILQGALTSLMSATSIIGPPIMTNLFAYFTKPSAPVHFAGAPFMLGAVLMLASTIIAYFSLRPNKKEQAAEEVVVEEEKEEVPLTMM
jgi:DHA1 family tetracycline resistance protein-like MFS transporter